MTNDDRRRLRAALRVNERLTAASNAVALPLLPLPQWRELEKACCRAAVASERGWMSAAILAHVTCRRLASEISERLVDFARAMDRVERPVGVQSPFEIVADLSAIESEFPEVELDLRERTVSVTTDPIVLQGIDLGRFSVVLHWERGEWLEYDVVALDPNPAASESSTMHPHVRDQELCEGDGRIPIRRALEQGRLYDFFLLVQGILRTYNAGSAYVALSRWNGAPCTGCGYTADEDESTSCDRCGAELCIECASCCQDCGRTSCSECREPCTACDDRFCTPCLRACDSCGESSCRNCLADGLCARCRESNDQPKPEENDDRENGDAGFIRSEAAEAEGPTEFASPGTAVYAVCLGEAAVPA